MSRRSPLPGADELFRSTGQAHTPAPAGPAHDERGTSSRDAGNARDLAPLTEKGPSSGSGGSALGTPRESSSRRDRGRADGSRDLGGDRRDLAEHERGLADERRTRRDPEGVDGLDDLDQAARAVRPTSRRRARPVADRRPSGRERHDEKITVYISADELLDLEHARLALRGDHGMAVDRGRLVREALAVVLADFEAKGEGSILVRRLQGR